MKLMDVFRFIVSLISRLLPPAQELLVRGTLALTKTLGEEASNIILAAVRAAETQGGTGKEKFDAAKDAVEHAFEAAKLKFTTQQINQAIENAVGALFGKSPQID